MNKAKFPSNKQKIVPEKLQNKNSVRKIEHVNDSEDEKKPKPKTYLKNISMTRIEDTSDSEDDED